MDGGAWQAAVHGVVTSRTRLSDFTFTFHFHALEKEMATYSSVLAWRIPGTGEPGGLPSMGLHRVGYDWSDLAAAAAAECRWFREERVILTSGLCFFFFNSVFFIQVNCVPCMIRQDWMSPRAHTLDHPDCTAPHGSQEARVPRGRLRPGTHPGDSQA